MTVSVLLADDQHLVRAGFRSLLRRDKDIVVVGEVSTGDEAVRTAPTTTMSLSRRSRLRNPARTRCWSSASRTEIVIAVSSPAP